MEPITHNSELRIKYLVVKVASRCNLNCTYCYMYNLGDNSYLNQPKVMSAKVVDAIIDKALGHCKRMGIDFFVFSFHGGEPLLAGKPFFKSFVKKAEEKFLPEKIQPYFALQTNGVLLTDDWCQHFAELGIEITISLDGDKETNDKYRIDHKGRGSYDRVVKGLKIAKNSTHKILPPGVLSVINIYADPVSVYQHFKDLDIHWFDLNHPDANYDSLPPEYSPSPDSTPYADWLIKMFDVWFAEKKDDKRPQIRL
ncbi:radical SAM protein [Pseudarcicella hirudinis]